MKPRLKRTIHYGDEHWWKVYRDGQPLGEFAIFPEGKIDSHYWDLVRIGVRGFCGGAGYEAEIETNSDASVV